MKPFERLKTVYHKVVKYSLNKSDIIRDMIMAIAGLTKSVNDLIKAYTTMAKMHAEDREAIMELYNMYSELLIAKHPSPSSTKPAEDKFSLNLNGARDAAEKKKGSLN